MPHSRTGAGERQPFFQRKSSQKRRSGSPRRPLRKPVTAQPPAALAPLSCGLLQRSRRLSGRFRDDSRLRQLGGCRAGLRGFGSNFGSAKIRLRARSRRRSLFSTKKTPRPRADFQNFAYAEVWLRARSMRRRTPEFPRLPRARTLQLLLAQGLSLRFMHARAERLENSGCRDARPPRRDPADALSGSLIWI